GAMPANMWSGMIATLKDRWARRRLKEMADVIAQSVQSFEESPIDLATAVIGHLDMINAIRSQRRMGSLDEGVEALKEALGTPNLRGATTGLLALDNKLNGYKAGQLYVVGGRPGM